jgi:hypothetical protein
LAKIPRRLGVDHGREQFCVNELVDSLEPLALRAIVAGAALVIQQHFQIVPKFVHTREL